MKKVKILIPIGCRSDEGLSKPIINRLQKTKWCSCDTINLNPSSYLESYEYVNLYLKRHKTDLVLCTGDRVEMTACACASYHNKVKVAHFYAGIIDYSYVVFDDINRHVITLYSDIQFCEDKKSKLITEKLLQTIGKKPNAYVVGISHLDDIEINESLVPKEEYNLVLINPTTTIEEQPAFLTERKTIIIGSNPDGIVKNLHPTYDNLPRPQFLGLLKNCTIFITNSSCAYYEAPFFLKKEQIIMIGKRNKQRTSNFNEMRIGASDRVVKLLRKYLVNKEKND